ncbi:hypothetical protein QVD17_14921 [Tagetes erecta]|uniref:Uncharacterized protein n=1 Tax=Tagetes erecta TaxID=13708 RepID=A0AAD8KS76_TARER|nr:hypothetical protein QVD17_14921 [Tagetes erecta]
MATVSEYLVWEACTAFSLPQPSPTSPFLSRCGDYAPLVESFLTKGPLKKANNLAIISVCNSGISSVMKKITGDEDVHTSMVAGFGYGVVISLATGMRGPNVLSVGVMCALFNGGMFKDERESALAKSGFFTNIMVVREAALSKSGFSTI